MTYRSKANSFLPVYTAGDRIFKNEVVLAGGWLQRANKETITSAEPVADGAPAFQFPDVPVWNTQSPTGDAFTGLDITLTKAISLTNVRIWIPGQVNLEHLVALYDVTGPAILLSAQFVAKGQSTGWFNLSSGFSTGLFFPGRRLRFAVQHSVDTNDVVDTGTWDKVASTGAPPAGDFFLIGVDQLNIADSDKTPTDKSASLLTLAINDEITITEEFDATRFQRFRLTEVPTDQTTFVQFLNLEIIQTGGNVRNVSCDISWDVSGAAVPTDYVRIVDGLLPLTLPGTAKGFFTQTASDVTGSPTLDDNIYGIDFEDIEYTFSTDYDTMAYSDSFATVGGTASASINFALGNIPINAARTVSVSPVSILLTDTTIIADTDAAAGDVTFNLPPSELAVGRLPTGGINIVKKGTGGSVFVNAFGSEKINKSTSFTIFGEDDSMRIEPVTGGWRIV